MNPQEPRLQAVDLAIAHLRRAAAGDKPICEAWLGLHFICETIRIAGPPVSRQTIEAVRNALWGVVVPIADADVRALPADRVAVAMGAAARAFEQSCCAPEDRQCVGREEADELAAQMLWVKAELEAAHRRAALAAGGDTLFRHALARHDFQSAVTVRTSH